VVTALEWRENLLEGGDMRTWPLRVFAVVAVVSLCLSAVALSISLTRSGTSSGRGTTFTPEPPAGRFVPAIVGKPKKVAEGVLVSVGLIYRVDIESHSRGNPPPGGTVLGEQPPAGAKVAAGAVVTLVVQP
jgi:eukaryotic-like serine/threonine-protein kinase